MSILSDRIPQIDCSNSASRSCSDTIEGRSPVGESLQKVGLSLSRYYPPVACPVAGDGVGDPVFRAEIGEQVPDLLLLAAHPFSMAGSFHRDWYDC